MSFPVTRPTGRALLVASQTGRAETLALLGGLGFECDDTDDPYTALSLLIQRPGVYQAVVLSLASHYKEELAVIATIKKRFTQVEVWLAQTDGRHAVMIEALRLGADGLLAGDGLHRVGMPAANGNSIGDTNAHNGHETSLEQSAQRHNNPGRSARRVAVNGTGNAVRQNPLRPSGEQRHDDDDDDLEFEVDEPVLSADELRALLQEQPFLPPNANEL